MKIWFTRPSAWDCLVKGLGRCTLWLAKPHFDPTPRGGSDLRIFAQMPKGWRVLDDDDLIANDSLSLQVGKLLNDFPELADKLWTAIGMSIDGQPPGDKYYKRWDALPDDEGMHSFLLECDVPPMLWWRIALYDGWENQTAAGRNFRERLAAGYEAN